jgi:hypothetical protein
VADTSSPRRNPESAKSSARAISARSTKDMGYPRTVIVPTWFSWMWKLHSKG